jgi:hypothetical protein
MTVRNIHHGKSIGACLAALRSSASWSNSASNAAKSDGETRPSRRPRHTWSMPLMRVRPMSHPMETGYRRDEVGNAIPRDIINGSPAGHRSRIGWSARSLMAESGR